MKYKERDELVASLRELADFLENNPRSIALPAPYRVYINTYSDHYDEEGDQDYEKTREQMRKIARAFGNCKKDYSGNNFELSKIFGQNDQIGGIEYSVNASRAAVCKRVVTGVEKIPARVVEAQEREIVDWVCEDPLLAS